MSATTFDGLDGLEQAERRTAGIQAHAQVSVGLHMSKNLLPTFLSITYPATYAPNDRVRIHLAPRNLADWLDSIAVDSDPTAHDAVEGVDGLLPDTGLRVTVFVTRLVVAS